MTFFIEYCSLSILAREFMSRWCLLKSHNRILFNLTRKILWCNIMDFSEGIELISVIITTKVWACLVLGCLKIYDVFFSI